MDSTLILDLELENRIAEMKAEQRLDAAIQRIEILVRINMTPKGWIKPLAIARRMGRRTVSTIAIAADQVARPNLAAKA